MDVTIRTLRKSRAKLRRVSPELAALQDKAMPLSPIPGVTSCSCPQTQLFLYKSGARERHCWDCGTTKAQQGPGQRWFVN